MWAVSDSLSGRLNVKNNRTARSITMLDRTERTYVVSHAMPDPKYCKNSSKGATNKIK
jgi:hypothetical protein